MLFRAHHELKGQRRDAQCSYRLQCTVQPFSRNVTAGRRVTSALTVTAAAPEILVDSANANLVYMQLLWCTGARLGALVLFREPLYYRYAAH